MNLDTLKNFSTEVIATFSTEELLAIEHDANEFLALGKQLSDNVIKILDMVSCELQKRGK